MTTELDFPTIDATPAAAVAAPTTDKPQLTELAVATLKGMEPQLRALAERHRNVALDLSTPGALTKAKAVRHELREQGRFAVQRSRDTTKDVLNKAKKLIELEADRLIAIVQPVEDSYNEQIEAREAVIEEERKQAAAKELERKRHHELNITTIRAYVGLAKGQPLDKLAAGLAHVEKMLQDFDPKPWEEYADRALQAIGQTIDELGDMIDRALEAERTERVRRENEELRAKLAQAESLRLASEAQAQRFTGQKVPDSEATVDPGPMTLPQAAAFLADPSPQSGAVVVTIPANVAAAAEIQAVMDDAKAMVEEVCGTPLIDEKDKPVLRLADISDRLGFIVGKRLLAALGIHPLGDNSLLTLYSENQWQAFKVALINHIKGLR